MLRLLACAAAGMGLLLMAPHDAAASKPQPIVTGTWHATPQAVPVGESFTVVLRLTASGNASDVTAEFLTPPGVEIVSGDRRWTGSLSAGSVRDLSVAVRVVADGVRTLGARITNTRPDGIQVSGAVMSIAANAGIATLITDPAKAWAAATPEERARLGIGAEAPQPPPARERQPRRKSPRCR